MDGIEAAMLQRLRDKAPAVRAEAAAVLARLAQPDEVPGFRVETPECQLHTARQSLGVLSCRHCCGVSMPQGLHQCGVLYASASVHGRA